MQEFKLTITISPDGETVEGEVSRMKGKKCANVAKLLDQVGEELEHRHTADWDRAEPVSVGRQTGRTITLGR
jgi:hypothetical protein